MQNIKVTLDTLTQQSVTMFTLLLCFLAISSVVVGQTHPPHTTEDGIACQECINEMHRFGSVRRKSKQAKYGFDCNAIFSQLIPINPFPGS